MTRGVRLPRFPGNRVREAMVEGVAGTGVQWLGAVAGLLSTVAFLPQVIRTWRRRSADDISGLTFGLFSLGVVLWLAYGILLELWPVVLANGVTLGLTVLILWAKLRFRRNGVPASGPGGG